VRRESQGSYTSAEAVNSERMGTYLIVCVVQYLRRAFVKELGEVYPMYMKEEGGSLISYLVVWRGERVGGKVLMKLPERINMKSKRGVHLREMSFFMGEGKNGVGT